MSITAQSITESVGSATPSIEMNGAAQWAATACEKNTCMWLFELGKTFLKRICMYHNINIIPTDCKLTMQNIEGIFVLKPVIQ